MCRVFAKISATRLGLKEGTDYKIYYFDNKKLGTAIVFVKAISTKGKAINLQAPLSRLNEENHKD